MHDAATREMYQLYARVGLAPKTMMAREDASKDQEYQEWERAVSQAM